MKEPKVRALQSEQLPTSFLHGVLVPCLLDSYQTTIPNVDKFLKLVLRVPFCSCILTYHIPRSQTPKPYAYTLNLL